jgi:hypothetical protein
MPYFSCFSSTEFIIISLPYRRIPMRILLVAICSLCLISGLAIAKDGPEKPVQPSLILADTIEIEPNDTCVDATANGNVLGVDDNCDAAIDPAGDLDYFDVTLAADGTFLFETHAGDAGDTKLYVYADDCLTQLGFDDDGGEGLYSRLEIALTAGTYYVMVQHYSASGTGAYILTMDEVVVVPPPANDVCEGAVDLQEQSLASFDVDLTVGYTNVEGQGSGSCTGYSTNGPDAFYKIYLYQGDSFTATEDGDCDMALYLFTDCADPFTSCLIGSDNCCSGAQESLTWTAEADGWYYLGVDAYTSAGCPVTVTIADPVSSDDTSWGSMKSMFR